MGEAPVVSLARGYGQARIETGLVIMRDRSARLFEPASPESETAWLRSIALHHEWIHFLQSITCASVHFAAQRILQLSASIIVAGSETPNELHRELKAQQCPHYESALCHRYFRPPKAKAGWGECGFPALISREAGVEPAALWAAAGRARKTVPDLVEAFEASGEADILALCRRQRRSIVDWLGEAGYLGLLHQCEAVADKTMEAMTKQDMNTAIEARMFRAAVVDQVRRLAADGEIT